MQYNTHNSCGIPSPIWYQSRGLGFNSPATQFSIARIPPSLASAGPTGTATSEWEQAVPAAAARTQEGECWTIA
jgi:hypothetical protein